MSDKPMLWGSQPTRSTRIHWTLTELGVDFDVTPVDFFGGGHKLPAYLEVNSAATVPAYRDTASSPLITESGATVQFILAKYGHGKLVPTPGTPAHAVYLQWCWFAEGTAMPAITKVAHHSLMLPEDQRVASVLKVGQDAVLQHLAMYESHLASTGSKYLVGDELTAADIMNACGLYFVVNFINLMDNAKFPKLAAYYELLTTHEGFKKAYDIPL